MNQFQRRWQWLFLLAALEAGVAFLALAVIPREAAGYSLARLALLALLGCLLVLWAILAAHPPRVLESLLRPGWILGTAVLALLLAVALFLLRYLDPIVLAPYYRRLSVVLWYLLAVSLQASAFLLVSRYGIRGDRLRQRAFPLIPTAIAFAALVLTLILIALTGLGITPDSAYWGEPGVPILGWQLAVVLIAGVGVLLLGLRLNPGWRRDAALGAVIWLVAVAMWLSVPWSVMHNSFYAPITPPAGQPFPNSDAGYYDSMAQSLLIGYPYQGEIPTRPLYIVLLTGLHLLVGERYDLIIAGQTLVLASIPVLLYFLGKSLHGRLAGVTVALIAIFRELTSLLVSSDTRVSNTKTLLVDLPTLLLVIAACLLAVQWLQRKDLRSAVLAGGLFGALLLLRTQAAMILPMLVLLAIAAWAGARWRSRGVLLGVFLGALVLTVLPWLVHNYLATGQLTFDAPFQYRIIASQYRYTGNLDINNVDLSGKGVLGALLTFAVRDPKFVLGFIANHSLATQVGGLLALPLIEPFNGLQAELNMYWLSWNGSLSWFNLLLVLGYLAIIAIGLGSAWRHFRWAGLVPLTFSLGYSVANGVGRFSGWRYDLPADWIWYFYFGVGVAEVIGLTALLLGAESSRVFAPEAVHMDSRAASPVMVIPLLGFVLLGSLPWLAERIAAPRYADATPARLIQKLTTTSAVQRLGATGQEIAAFATSPRATLEVGRILYPRFFTRDTGLASAHPWPAYAPRDFPRLGFLLLNQTRHDVIFRSRQSPAPFPHAADAVILGCQGDDHIEARLVLLVDSGIAYLSTPLEEPCP